MSFTYYFSPYSYIIQILNTLSLGKHYYFYVHHSTPQFDRTLPQWQICAPHCWFSIWFQIVLENCCTIPPSPMQWRFRSRVLPSCHWGVGATLLYETRELPLPSWYPCVENNSDTPNASTLSRAHWDHQVSTYGWKKSRIDYSSL